MRRGWVDQIISDGKYQVELENVDAEDRLLLEKARQIRAEIEPPGWQDPDPHYAEKDWAEFKALGPDHYGWDEWLQYVERFDMSLEIDKEGTVVLRTKAKGHGRALLVDNPQSWMKGTVPDAGILWPA